MLTGMCTLLAARHGAEFADRAAALIKKKRKLIAPVPDGMVNPYKIDGTDLYLETNYSAKNVLENVHGLMALFGYQPTDFGYETQND